MLITAASYKSFASSKTEILYPTTPTALMPVTQAEVSSLISSISETITSHSVELASLRDFLKTIKRDLESLERTLGPGQVRQLQNFKDQIIKHQRFIAAFRSVITIYKGKIDKLIEREKSAGTSGDETSLQTLTETSELLKGRLAYMEMIFETLVTDLSGVNSLLRQASSMRGK